MSNAAVRRSSAPPAPPRSSFVEPRLTHDCNVILVGDVRVGKTALANRFVHGKFSEVREEVLRTWQLYPLPPAGRALPLRPSSPSHTYSVPHDRALRQTRNETCALLLRFQDEFMTARSVGDADGGSEVPSHDADVYSLVARYNLSSGMGPTMGFHWGPNGAQPFERRRRVPDVCGSVSSARSRRPLVRSPLCSCAHKRPSVRA